MPEYKNCDDLQTTFKAMERLELLTLLDFWVNCAKMAEQMELTFGMKAVVGI